MFRKEMKRWMAFAICLLMVFMSFPIAASADDGDTIELKCVETHSGFPHEKFCTICPELGFDFDKQGYGDANSTDRSGVQTWGGIQANVNIDKNVATFNFAETLTVNYIVLQTKDYHFFFAAPDGEFQAGVTYQITTPKVLHSNGQMKSFDISHLTLGFGSIDGEKADIDIGKLVGLVEASSYPIPAAEFKFNLLVGSGADLTDVVMATAKISTTQINEGDSIEVLMGEFKNVSPGIYTIKEDTSDKIPGWTYDTNGYVVTVDGDGNVTFDDGSYPVFENNYSNQQEPEKFTPEVGKLVSLAEGGKYPIPSATFEFQLTSNGAVEATATVTTKEIAKEGDSIVVETADFDTAVAPGTYKMVEVLGSVEQQKVWNFSNAEITVVIGEDGTITYDGEETAVFTNSYTKQQEDSDDATVKGSKEVVYDITSGIALPDEPTFYFNLLNSDKEIVATASATFAKGEETTKPFTFTPVEGKTITEGEYTMVEVDDRADAANSKWAYDASEIMVTVLLVDGKYSVGYGSGDIKAIEATPFLNTYTDRYIPEEGEAKVDGNKAVTYDTNGSAPTETFKFELYTKDEAGNRVVAARAEVTFSDWEANKLFTFVPVDGPLQPGFYFMSEVKGTDTRWAYDEKEYLVTIGEDFSVSYAASDETPLDNAPTFENKYTYNSGGGEERKTTTRTSTTTIPDSNVPLADVPATVTPDVVIPEPEVPLADIPQTGADGDMAFNLAMMGLSLSALMTLLFGRKKKMEK